MDELILIITLFRTILNSIFEHLAYFVPIGSIFRVMRAHQVYDDMDIWRCRDLRIQ